MYGLILENLAEYIRHAYGEETWETIRRQAGVDQSAFSVHQVFPETVVPILAKKAQQVLGVSDKEFMNEMGEFFVKFVGQYGYDKVLSVLGRHLRDFLNGLDNLHEYLKFSYPKLKAPSFMCENETRHGLTLHYKTKRTGFVFYTMGQITAVAKLFYHKELVIEVLNEEIETDTLHVTFQLTFDNRAFTLASLSMTRDEKHLPVSAAVLFEIFPFCIVFGNDLIIRSIGNSLMVILPELLGKKITVWFELIRPLIAFKFNTILNRRHNIFEMVTVGAPVYDNQEDGNKGALLEISEGGKQDKTLRLKASAKGKKEKIEGRKKPGDIAIKLKGQMIYMENWKLMMYLATPVMPDLSALIKTGLYINDLSMHDFSRDLMLAGAQQSVELKLALDQEQQKSKKLEESMKKLDEEMKRTDELLYQMIPRQVADRLRTGENPIDTCEIFESVSVLFSDVVTFTEICSRITPMEVVSMLNAMYSIFDNLTEKNKVYKVETIGDAYMVVAGAPDKDHKHAERVCDMAMDMVDAITDLKDPSTGKHLQIRVGVHSGAVVAGIVGLKMPRYCLFGDSVNTASRMESTSEAMKIHISECTKELIPPSYHVEERGEIMVKGKGSMKTYWLKKIDHRIPLQKGSSPRPAWGQTTKSITPIPSRAYTPVQSGNIDSRMHTAGTITAYSPSDVFGPLVTDEMIDDLDLYTPEGDTPTQGNLVDRHTTPPAHTNDNRKTNQVFAEVNVDKSVSPSSSAQSKTRKNKKQKAQIPIPLESPDTDADRLEKLIRYPTKLLSTACSAPNTLHKTLPEPILVRNAEQSIERKPHKPIQKPVDRKSSYQPIEPMTIQQTVQHYTHPEAPIVPQTVSMPSIATYQTRDTVKNSTKATQTLVKGKNKLANYDSDNQCCGSFHNSNSKSKMNNSSSCNIS